MIALLTCSTSWSRSRDADDTSSTGGLTQDSVLIAYSDLKIANAKMTELKYEKEINKKYRDIISNDSIAINYLNLRISNMDKDYKRNIRRVKRERNALGATSISAIVLLIISLL